MCGEGSGLQPVEGDTASLGVQALAMLPAAGGSEWQPVMVILVHTLKMQGHLGNLPFSQS